MSNIQRGNEALARIRASKEAARASGSRPAACSVAEERTVSDLLASALIGEYPAEAALKRYCATLASSFDVQTVMAKFRSKPPNDRS